MRIIKNENIVSVDDKKIVVEMTGKELAIIIALLWNVTASDVDNNLKNTMYKKLCELEDRNVDSINSLTTDFEEAFEALL